ncbi:helix-turn-helix domain-containing protein [Micromonospora sp. NBC_01655]|uniref:AraC-like ligand-binding domain-containing protein n=1 Tax=Micromonospora sp. NBC_01655 TaxID=2975983 RepID=UPI0022529A7B|nr:helix-turn-helix domain-containing protein [Micromonospora sp. NBC_01655]MCX4471474.1 helix-turn-helix domain-containing protein [Micromonospora sp. NBC_01655]
MDVVSTADVSPGDRFAFWREVSAKLWVPYDLARERQAETGFEARVGISEFGPVQATLMTTMAHSVRRTPRLIRQADPEVFKVSCTVSGSGTLTQDGRRAEFGTGDLVLYDTSRPYVAELRPDDSTSRMLLLRFPRALLPFPPQELRELSAVRIPGARGVGALSSRFLLQLADQMDELTPAETARLATLTLDVLITALADALDIQKVVPADTRQRALTARIHAFIRDHLGNPDLTPNVIAAAHHISVRYLHKLFQQEEHTVAGWIRVQRLDRCRRDLAEPRLAGRTINAIAARWGFTSAAHFSQAFRARYGQSPTEFRQQLPTVHGD